MPQAMVMKDEKCPKCNGWLITQRVRIDGILMIGGVVCGKCGYFRKITPSDYRYFCEKNCVYWKWGPDTTQKIDKKAEEY